MKISYLTKQLASVPNPKETIIKLGHPLGLNISEVHCAEGVEDYTVGADAYLYCNDKAITAAELEDILQYKFSQSARAYVHSTPLCTSEEALFLLTSPAYPGIAWIECASDNDMSNEISARYDHLDELKRAAEEKIEEEFYKNMDDVGITLDMIKDNYPEYYEDAKKYLSR